MEFSLTKRKNPDKIKSILRNSPALAGAGLAIDSIPA